MICPLCQRAGDWNAAREYLAADRLHAQCTDRDCSCQHGTGAGWIARV